MVARLATDYRTDFQIGIRSHLNTQPAQKWVGLFFLELLRVRPKGTCGFPDSVKMQITAFQGDSPCKNGVSCNRHPGIEHSVMAECQFGLCGFFP